MFRSCLLLLTCVFMVQANEPMQPVTIHNTHPRKQEQNFQIEIKSNADQVVIDLQQIAGIGQAEVTRQAKQWPKQMILRFHLGGLEHLTIKHGDWRYKLSVLSHSGNKQLGEWEQDQKTEQLNEKSPRWLEVRRLNKQGQAIDGLPVIKDGDYFEMTLPKTLLNDESDKIELGWIDFYR
jgi:hypothetical protein